ncbi:MAG: hypothetical protein LEGION0398_MBIBDBAK_00390 [Legionellaceae bacterium]
MGKENFIDPSRKKNLLSQPLSDALTNVSKGTPPMLNFKGYMEIVLTNWAKNSPQHYEYKNNIFFQKITRNKENINEKKILFRLSDDSIECFLWKGSDSYPQVADLILNIPKDKMPSEIILSGNSTQDCAELAKTLRGKGIQIKITIQTYDESNKLQRYEVNLDGEVCAKDDYLENDINNIENPETLNP